MWSNPEDRVGREGIIIPYFPLQTAYEAILPAWYNANAQKNLPVTPKKHVTGLLRGDKLNETT
jgi:hypothetical protein